MALLASCSKNHTTAVLVVSQVLKQLAACLCLLGGGLVAEQVKRCQAGSMKLSIVIRSSGYVDLEFSFLIEDMANTKF